jgi:hypothetical protein
MRIRRWTAGSQIAIFVDYGGSPGHLFWVNMGKGKGQGHGWMGLPAVLIAFQTDAMTKWLNLWVGKWTCEGRRSEVFVRSTEYGGGMGHWEMSFGVRRSTDTEYNLTYCSQ